ncbi:hypothetical protein L1049_011678 [Liquidambar formosana]|uniref:Uncharacterized protein n=1 Tax=Liquidambar formosana TaxID=63359 RepID=A0AAP0WZZ8_LIQFO
MAMKKTIAALLISALVVMACTNMSEALSQCAKDCMPVCMGVEGATVEGCGPSCEDYCNQLSGGQGDRAGGGGGGIISETPK